MSLLFLVFFVFCQTFLTFAFAILQIRFRHSFVNPTEVIFSSLFFLVGCCFVLRLTFLTFAILQIPAPILSICQPERGNFFVSFLSGWLLFCFPLNVTNIRFRDFANSSANFVNFVIRQPEGGNSSANFVDFVIRQPEGGKFFVSSLFGWLLFCFLLNVSHILFRDFANSSADFVKSSTQKR